MLQSTIRYMASAFFSWYAEWRAEQLLLPGQKYYNPLPVIPSSSNKTITFSNLHSFSFWPIFPCVKISAISLYKRYVVVMSPSFSYTLRPFRSEPNRVTSLSGIWGSIFRKDNSRVHMFYVRQGANLKSVTAAYGRLLQKNVQKQVNWHFILTTPSNCK